MSEQGTRAKHGKDHQRTQPQPDTLKRNQPAQTVEKIKKVPGVTETSKEAPP